jgi:multidrug resistance efflux pump
MTLLLLVTLPCQTGFTGNEETAQRVPVKVFEVITRDISSTLFTMGTIKYVAKADVSSEIDGVLSFVNVEEGGSVQKGQIIAVIDSTLLKAQLKQAKAILEMAEIELLKSKYRIRKTRYRIEAAKISMEKWQYYLETQKKLFNIGAIHQSELDKAEISYEKSLADYKSSLEDLSSLQVTSKEGRSETETKAFKARADVEEIRFRLKKCTIKAPISGLVAIKRKWSGERVSPGDSVIVTLLDTKDVYAEVDVNEKDMGLIEIGQEVETRADAYPDLPFSGKVRMISPTVDTNSRTVKVRVKIANDKQLLKPGMFVRVNIMLESRKDVIAINR